MFSTLLFHYLYDIVLHSLQNKPINLTEKQVQSGFAWKVEQNQKY